MKAKIARRTFITTLALIVVMLSTSCEAGKTEGATTQPPASSTIECLVAYRSSVTRGIEREQVVTLAAPAPQQTVALGDLVFRAQYRSGDAPPNEHALRVWVTTGDSATELVSQLFQLPSTDAVRNQFVGGHGFTGLSYVYHPASGAELQYTCAAQE